MNRLTKKLINFINSDKELRKLYLEHLDSSHDCKLLDPDCHTCDCVELRELINE